MPILDSLGRDVRQSVRTLVRERSFSFTVLLIFTLCLAANVAIFAVVNSVLLKPLPFHEPHQLVSVANSYPKAGVDRAGASIPHYLERQEQMKDAFVEVAATRDWGATIGDAGSPERVEAAYVTPSFFRMLGANPALGRTFTDEEAVYGKNQVVILGDAIWRQRYGADPKVVGKTLRIDTSPCTIIGVMPADFRFLGHKPKIWSPLCFSDDDKKAQQRHANNMEMFGRLRPGVTIARAQTELDALNARMLKTDPYAKLVEDAGFHTVIRDLGDDFVAQLRPVLLLLQAGVASLLLIGAVNLANLLLVRATGRAKEFCIRQALGAGRVQLARSLLTETLVLAVTGGVLGLGLGAAALKGILVLAANQLPVHIAAGLDWRVCAAALGASVLLGVALAVPVVWQTLHGNLTAALSVESRGGTTTRAVHRLRHLLIVAQIAVAFILLAGTGLLGLSFSKLMAVRPGFQTENVLTGGIALPWSHYKEDKDRLAFVERLTQDLAALPGVKSVGVSTGAPFTGGANDNATWIEGQTLAPGESLQAHFMSGVAGDYFQTLGVPLLAGRYLNAADSRSSTLVCVVDEDVAKRYWPKGDAIGHRLAHEPPGKDTKWFTVVGIVGAVKQNDLADQKKQGAVYFPFGTYAGLWFAVAVRTTQTPELAGPALRAAVLRIDPELPLDDLKTMKTRVEDSVAGRRVPLLLAGIFACVALVLAAVGIYGVLAYAVAQRQREIGVRMALGALPEQILRQFLGLGGKLLVIGLPLGLLGAWFAGRAMSGLLFGVKPTNPLVLAAAAAAIAAVAMLACLLPSRRAARVAPVEALRGN
ncbi:MAG TPA: ABC transporter permease [Opitutus sp.]|nr:ABC transporter permease [Opitutus sp.]